ncbi:unnamed protein product [Orchesella dallaii]|uniref:Uncharacterized protein n=1 Tax=Orchesella dallaii TaxID=48710 RepID=A0ABP1R8X1_9HEXA
MSVPKEVGKLLVLLITLNTIPRSVASLNRMTLESYHNVRPILNIEEREPSDQELEPELRNSPPKSDLLQLIEDDEKKLQTNSTPKHPGEVQSAHSPRMDCSKITMQIFQVLLQNPDNVEPEDYSCGLLNLISHVEKSHGRIRSLEASLNTATSTIKTLETSLTAEISKSHFVVKELNETVHKETERAIKAENVIARRVLSEKSRVDAIQKNLTDVLSIALEQIKQFGATIQDMESQVVGVVKKPQLALEPGQIPLSPVAVLMPPVPQINNEQEIQNIESKLSSLQDFITQLSNRVNHMEEGSDENTNKGITQIFKTYASLANEIEKETERATTEETALKTFIGNEVSSLSKQITNLQERITDEKNRAQVIENRRTADLFEEINRAKAEENRLGLKLKDEMSKAAAAFKKLESHVDHQYNSTKGLEDDIRAYSDKEMKRAIEAEERLAEQINFERTRAQSVENSLKTHLETEVSRAMGAENNLLKLNNEEKERARKAEHELKVAVDVETYRAKGVELSISAQVSAEAERAKQEESQLSDNLNGNMTRILTDIIKEFTRAQNAEKQLDDKIHHEMSRAFEVEKNLLENINAELARATEKEEDLHQLIRQQEASIKSLDQVRTLVVAEEVRAKNVEANLETLFQVEYARAKGEEDRLMTLINEEISKGRLVATNFTEATSDILRHTRELELEVRKTVMAEVARAVDAENGIKQQLFLETDRALKAEARLMHYQSSNYSDVSNRFQLMNQEIERENLRLEDITLSISRNLTGDILTLAELFDDKLDDLERNENVRLKKLEDDMKKCCSGSSWRWRNSKQKSSSSRSAAGSVLSKIMQVFGGIVDDEAPTTAKESDRSIKSGESFVDDFVEEVDSPQYVHSKNDTIILPIVDDEDSSKSESDMPSSNKTESFPATLKNNLIKEDETKEKSARMENLNKRNLARASRRVINKPSVVSVQSIYPKVTQTFG